MAVKPTFLASLAPAEQQALLAAGHRRRWAAGETMFRDGDATGSAVLVLSGLVKIHKRGADGEDVVLTLSGPGDLLGEGTAPARRPRTAGATALENVDAVTVDTTALRALLAAHPQLALALLELALTRLQIADARRLESATSGSLTRVAGRLVELAERFGTDCDDGSIDVSMPITQEDLASWAAASRESTARALRTLRELHLIDTHRRRLVVHDLEQLRSHATGL